MKKLTSAQMERMSSYADEWIEGVLDPAPADRAKVEDGMRRCYEYAGLPWHGNVVWVPSPLIVAFAGPIASHVLGDVGNSEHRAIRDIVDDVVHKAVNRSASGPARNAGGTVGMAVHGAVGEPVRSAINAAVRDSVIRLTEAVSDAVYGAVHSKAYNTAIETIRGPISGAIESPLYSTSEEGVRDAIRSVTRGPIREAIHRAVDNAVREVVLGAIRSVASPILNVVGMSVYDPIDVTIPKGVTTNWAYYLGGKCWASWMAYVGFFRDCTGLDLDVWDRSRAYEDANSAGWWWPHRQFVVVSEAWIRRPQLEQIAPRGWGSHRLHSLGGPALSFDGWDLYYIHGVPVDKKVVMSPESLTVDDVWAADNQEVRRTIIEQMGWDRFVSNAGLTLIDSQPDPANPGHTIELYDMPRVYDTPTRVILVDNATIDRDGTRRRFGLTVPAEISDALHAVAWTFDLDKRKYAALQRAT